MKKFSFKLETVLKLKEKVLNDKMLELAKITRLLADAQKTLNNLIQEKNNTSEDIIKVNSPGREIDISSVQIYGNYLIKTMSNITNQERLIVQIKKAVIEKQKEVNEALKERDILEKLKEKQLEKHNKENDYKERTELDDMALSRYKAS